MIRLDKVSKQFRTGVFALSDVSFEVEKGDELHLNYERFYPKNHTKDFVQGYSWSGSITRDGQTVYEFSQMLG